jgi:hypothetical protein
LSKAATARVECACSDFHLRALAFISNPRRLAARWHERPKDRERLDNNVVISAAKDWRGGAAGEAEP